MALRVLLADESSTIKKVFQLALQDYAVEVTSVAAGLDVVPATRQFKPDIIFCDILLQKKNGYEVCSEIKADPTLRQIPVVLMWSGFMELDQDKLEAAHPDGKLEKPFDVEQLRQIVQKLVPRTQTQRLGQFLSFPKMPEMIEPAQAQAPEATNPPEGSWNMDHFDPIPAAPSAGDEREEFEEMPLPPPPRADALGLGDDDDDSQSSQWSATRLTRFNVKASAHEPDELAVDLPADENETADNGIELEEEPPAPPPRPRASVAKPPTGKAVPSEAQIELQVREQARAIIEAVVWKIVPDLATQIIEREIKRLLAEKGSSPQP